MPHTPVVVGLGSAALAAAVALPIRKPLPIKLEASHTLIGLDSSACAAAVAMALHIQVHGCSLGHRAQELCESRGGRPGLPPLIVFMVSVDAKQN